MTGMEPPTAPAVIRIKRKRDEEPLDSLLLDRSKRRAKEGTYVFKRANVHLRKATAAKQEYDELGIPKIRTTAIGEEKRDPYALGKTVKSRRPGNGEDGKQTPANTQPRRFHLARGSISVGARIKGSLATFMERRSHDQQSTQAAMAESNVKQTDAQPDAESGGDQKKFKRPLTKASRTPKDTVVNALPDADFLHQLDQWSLETSQKEDREKQADKADPIVVNDMEVDDADYVYDTYYRQLVSSDEVVENGISIGHLIIEEDEEDLWEAYLEDGGDSEDGFDTDDQDSNAEDYYGADYPEDEVDIDDEYDREAYQFRDQADDLEEFDVHERYHEYDEHVDGIARSDDGDYEDRMSKELAEARAWRSKAFNNLSARN